MPNFRLTRKDFLRLGGAGLGAMTLHSTLPVVGAKLARGAGRGRRPNILMICMDQLQSWVDLPGDLPLPAHERMLREGRGFSNFYVHQGPCAPSRSVIYTGQHVQKTGVYTNPPSMHAELDPDAPPFVELSPDFPTIGDMLRDEGYYTAYKGKWHLSVINQKVRAATPEGYYPDSSNALEEFGFSNFNHDGDHIGLTWVGFGHDGFIAADAVNLLHDFSRGYTEGKPWFLAINFINPHDIKFFDKGRDAPETRSMLHRIAPPKEPPRIPFYDREWDVPLPRSFYEDDLSAKPAVQRAESAFARDDAAIWRLYRDYYFNCIRDVDRHIDTVLKSLDRLGLAESTIVILTADHGELAAAHGMRGKGADIYKETLRVPLIIRHPDVKGGAVTEALGGACDLAPTLLSFAGLEGKARTQRYPDLPGVDLSPAVGRAQARTERDERGILLDYVTTRDLSPEGPVPEVDTRSLIRGIYDGRYKFARYFSVTQHHRPRDWETLVAHNDLELYDTHADPDEIVNLAHEPQKHRDRILALNARVNDLIEREVGSDNGSIYPGPAAPYNTSAIK